jgi:hypothetical protein
MSFEINEMRLRSMEWELQHLSQPSERQLLRDIQRDWHHYPMPRRFR